MTKNEPVVAVCNSHVEAEEMVKELQKSGFDMKKLSIIGRDYHTEENVVGYYNTGDRMKYWGKMGAFWGGIWGVFFGAAFFWVPGIGQVLAAGPLVAAIVGALEGAVVVGGLDAIGAGLYSLGIPKDSILQYRTALKANKFVVVAHGTPEEISAPRRSCSAMRTLEAMDAGHWFVRASVVAGLVLIGASTMIALCLRSSGKSGRLDGTGGPWVTSGRQ